MYCNPLRETRRDTGCGANLGFKLLTELLGFVLFEVVHDHHGGVDLANCHVGICEGQVTRFISCYCLSHECDILCVQYSESSDLC